MKPFDDLIHPRHDPLQQLIESEVQDLQKDPTEPGKYVELVKLGHQHRETVPPEQFRIRLINAGLIATRASEIKAILRFESVAERFINREPGFGVRDALRESRRPDPNGTGRQESSARRFSDNSPDPGQARRSIVRALERLLEETNRQRWFEAAQGNGARVLDCGLFQIAFVSSPVDQA